MFVANIYPQNNSQHTKSLAVLTLAAFSTRKSGQGVGRHKFRSFFCLLKFVQILTALGVKVFLLLNRKGNQHLAE